MTAGGICTRMVATAAPTESVRAAASRMAEQGVGTLVVLEPNRPDRAMGLVTDRDIAVRCVAAGLDPAKTPISMVMTTPVQSVEEYLPIEDAILRMAGGGTRRLVVTGPGHKLVGLLSVDDVLDLLVEEADAIARLLEKQRPRVPV